MSVYLQFIILGFVAGSVYAVLGTSLVCVYTSTGILNFAQGAMAMWPAFAYARLQSTGDLVLPIGKIHVGAVSTALAVVVAVVCGVVLVLIAHYLVFRPLRSASTLAQVAASVGLLVTIQALVVLRFGTAGLTAAAVLPTGDVGLFGTSVSEAALILAGIALAISACFWLYFRLTTAGIATRAAAEDEQGARLLGYSPTRLSTIVWTMTGAACGLVAVLATPQLGLDSTTLVFYVVPALAVALIGRLSSIATTCLAGLLLGSFQAVIGYLAGETWWPKWAQVGLQNAVPFLVVIVTMYLLGGRIPARGVLSAVKLPDVVIPRLRPVPVAVTTAVCVVLLLVTTGNWRLGVITSMILFVLSLSVVVLTGYLGQISLAQMAFAGTSGFALSKFTFAYDWHIPFPLSIIAAALAATALGVLVGIPALRIRGAQLAVVTLAAAVAIQSFVLTNPQLTPLEGDRVASPKLFGLDMAISQGGNPVRVVFGLMVLVVVLIVVFCVARILRGSTGTAFLAIRSNERAAASAGINVASTKLLGFALSAFLAGIGGSLLAYSSGAMTPESFTALTGLSLLATAYLGGIGSIGGAAIAGVLGPLGLAYVFLNQTLDAGKYYVLISGLALTVAAILYPTGIAGTVQQLMRRFRAPSSGDAERPGAGRTAELSAYREEIDVA